MAILMQVTGVEYGEFSSHLTLIVDCSSNVVMWMVRYIQGRTIR